MNFVWVTRRIVVMLNEGEFSGSADLGGKKLNSYRDFFPFLSIFSIHSLPKFVVFLLNNLHHSSFFFETPRFGPACVFLSECIVFLWE